MAHLDMQDPDADTQALQSGQVETSTFAPRHPVGDPEQRPPRRAQAGQDQRGGRHVEGMTG